MNPRYARISPFYVFDARLVPRPPALPPPARATSRPSSSLSLPPRSAPLPCKVIDLDPTPLSPREVELLASFVILGFDLQALVDRFSLQPAEVLDFLDSAPIRARLRSIRAFTDLSNHLASSRDRRAAFQALHDVLASARDPVERRRAATAILRFSAPPSRVPNRTPSPSSTPLRTDLSPEALSSALSASTARGESPLSLIRETLAPEATITGAPLPPDPPQLSSRCTDDSPLAPLRESVALVSLARHGDRHLVRERALALDPSGPTHDLDPRPEARGRWRIASLDLAPSTSTRPRPEPIDSG